MLARLLKLSLIVLIIIYGKALYHNFSQSPQPTIAENYYFTNNIYSNYLKAYYTAKERQYEATGNYFLKAVKLGGNKNLLMDSLICFTLGGNFNKVLEIINEYKLSDKDYYIKLIKAIEQFKNNKFEEAEKNIASLAKDEELSFFAILQAWIQYEKGLPNEGIQQLQQLLERLSTLQESEPSLEISMQIALMYDLQNDKEQAKNYYDQIASHSLSAIDSILIANFYERNGYSTEANRIYDDYHNKNPLNFLFLSEKENLSKSYNHKTKIISNSKDALAYHIIAIGDFFINNFNSKSINQSLFYYQLANFLSDSAFTKLSLLEALIQSTNLEVASNVQHLLSLANNITTPHRKFEYLKNYRLAEIYYKANQLDLAETILKKLIQENSLVFQNYLFLSDIYKKMQTFQKNIELYDHFIDSMKKTYTDLPESSWFVYLMRGEAYDMMGQPNEASQDYQKALAINPTHPSILNNLAYNWLEQNHNLQEAEKLLLKALEIRPKDPAILDSIAWCYYLQGDYVKAQSYSEQSVDLMPNDPITNEHLGDIYYKLERKTEALYQWNYALECTEITSNAKEKIQTKINSLEL